MRQLDVDFRCRCQRRGLAGIDVDIETWRRRWPRIVLPMLGDHQAQNCAIAAATLDVLADGGLEYDAQAAALGATNVKLAGRIDVVGRDPLVVIDVAHNDASAEALAATLQHCLSDQSGPSGPRILIFGASREKDWRLMLRLLAPCFDYLIVTNYVNNPRAVPAGELAAALAESGLHAEVAADPELAWQRARQLAAPQNLRQLDALPRPAEALICITGSFYLAAELYPVICPDRCAPATSL